MTSISSLSSTSYQSPLQKLEAELQSEVARGTISSSDASTLSSALKDIDSELQAGGSSQAGGTTSSPGDLHTKIDNLIQNEVSSGKLTSDQAIELKGVFKAAFSHGAGGPPPDADSTLSATGSSSTGSTTNSSSGSNATADALQQLLQLLQSSLSNSNSASTVYDASGAGNTSDSSSSASAILVDYRS